MKKGGTVIRRGGSERPGQSDGLLPHNLLRGLIANSRSVSICACVRVRACSLLRILWRSDVRLEVPAAGRAAGPARTRSCCPARRRRPAMRRRQTPGSGRRRRESRTRAAGRRSPPRRRRRGGRRAPRRGGTRAAAASSARDALTSQ